MSRFEFNTVLVSIVLAFAISEILTAWGRMIRNRKCVTSPALLILASSWVLLAIIVHWFGLWAYEQAPFDRLLETVLVLLPALVIALVCFVWVPDIPTSGVLDLEKHYFEAGSWTLPLIALFMLLGAIADISVPNVSFSAPFWLLAGWASLFLALRFSRNRAFHIGVFGVSWLLYVALIGLRM
jgi:hypothetical protein